MRAKSVAMEDARVEEAFRTMDHESFSRMMWHIGKAAIVATCILGLMMCLALAKGWRLGRGGEKPGYVVPKRVWITLLLPNALMHACGGQQAERYGKYLPETDDCTTSSCPQLP